MCKLFVKKKLLFLTRCYSVYLSSCQRTASNANCWMIKARFIENSSKRYQLDGQNAWRNACLLRNFQKSMFVWISLNSCPLILTILRGGQRKSQQLRRKRTRNYSKILAAQAFPQSTKNNRAANARASVKFQKAGVYLGKGHWAMPPFWAARIVYLA